MEIVINKKTYILKPINQYRRELFSNCVLPFYNNNEMTKEQYIEFDKNIHFVLWEFLKDEDKKQIGIKEDLEAEVSQLGKFINWINKSITNYIEYIKLNSDEENAVTQKVETVFAFLSQQFGWTFEYMQEMDELTLLKALKEACELHKKDSINKVNLGALVGAFSAGNKQAKRKIDEMNREARLDSKVEQMKTSKIEKKGEFLSDEQLRSL